MLLEDLETDVLLEFLRCARRGRYVGAIAALEAALSSRLHPDAPVNAPFPLSYIAHPDRRRDIALARLKSAAERQSSDVFRENLWNLHPDNFAHAWLLARSFDHEGERADALRHVSYWITAHFKGHDDAERFVEERTNPVSPGATIRALEEHFGSLIDQATRSNVSTIRKSRKRGA